MTVSFRKLATEPEEAHGDSHFELRGHCEGRRVFTINSRGQISINGAAGQCFDVVTNQYVAKVLE